MIANNQGKKKYKRWKLLVVLAVVALFLTVLGINLFIVRSTNARIFNQVANLPQREFGLVMGTDLMRGDGSTNLHFLNRTESAAKLFSSGKVKRLLISGNPHNKGFNEVLGMQAVLLKKGVPANAISLDFGGVRTWETARRARDIYHLQEVTIVTDDFHAPRSIFLCDHFGINAVAFCSGEEPVGFWSVRSKVREWLSRVKASFETIIDGKAN